MTLHELRDHVNLTFPPGWFGPAASGSSGPIGMAGTILSVVMDEEQEGLRLTCEWQGTVYFGTLLCSAPTVWLPRILRALEPRLPIRVEDAAALEIPEGR
jgi:hypothetical protein